ncbi:MAG: ankyrin repeat domain-containing protein [Spirochaetes bacterium]|nr:ankyrin repeat domain-containing protein [Spirochaetota bacterium]MBN2770252.1 ankyrin repeat domain-containing protein [Spirochaetota bacterium]
MAQSFIELWNSGKTSLEETKTLAREIKAIKTGELIEQALWAPDKEIRDFLIDKAVKTKISLKNGLNDFHAAAVSGRMEDFERAKERGADPDCMLTGSSREAVNGKPMHLAARMNHSDIIKGLLDLGLSPDTPGENELTPLMRALRYGSNDAARLLIDAGADLNKTETFFEESPLFFISDGIETEIIDLMLSKGMDLQQKNKYSWTAAYSILGSKQFETFYTLCEKGLPVVFDNGTNCLIYILDDLYGNYGYKEAHLENYLRLIDFLIDHPDIDLNKTAALVDYPYGKKIKKTTALDVALQVCRPEIVKHLLDKGAALPKRFNPVHFLNEGNWILKKKALLEEKGISIDPDALTIRVMTGMLRNYDKEQSQMMKLFPELMKNPGFKDLKDDNGIDIFFKFLLTSLSEEQGPRPLIDSALIDGFLEAGCPIDISYDVNNLDEIYDINYKFSNKLKRSSYTAIELLQDLSSNKYVKQALEQVKNYSPKEIVEPLVGEGYGFEWEAYITLTYGVVIENCSYETVVRLNQYCNGLTADIIPIGYLTIENKNEGLPYTCVLGITSYGTPAWNGPEKVKSSKLNEAEKEWTCLDDAFWAEVSEICEHPVKKDQPKLYLAATGPLAWGRLVSGVPGQEEDEGKDGKFYRGMDMEQEPHSEGVWGEALGTADAGEWPVEISPEQLKDKKSLYLIACID